LVIRPTLEQLLEPTLHMAQVCVHSQLGLTSAGCTHVIVGLSVT